MLRLQGKIFPIPTDTIRYAIIVDYRIIRVLRDRGFTVYRRMETLNGPVSFSFLPSLGGFLTILIDELLIRKQKQ